VSGMYVLLVIYEKISINKNRSFMVSNQNRREFDTGNIHTLIGILTRYTCLVYKHNDKDVS
jgi:hypothetical protein